MCVIHVCVCEVYYLCTSRLRFSRIMTGKYYNRDVFADFLPYTPRHDFSPMDCTDMVIGTARGNISRIWDYYTRDR